MQAIVVDAPGDESVLKPGDVSAPALRLGSIRIATRAAGVNRGDLLQRQGLYPPPPGASEIIGLECAGEVVAVADDVAAWKPGDRVMALLSGGGYAAEAVVAADNVMAIPDGLSYVEGAALPEVMLTVYRNVWQLGDLPVGGSVLVHGGGSGIGTATIQLVKAWQGTVIVTAGTAEKCQRCLDLGADAAANYNEDDFAGVVEQVMEGHGVDLVLDSIGAPYLAKNLACLALEGRLVLIGLMGGAKTEINLSGLMLRRLQVIGSTLRALSEKQKAGVVSGFLRTFGESLRSGAVRPIVDTVFPLAEAAEAHRLMKASTHFGKIILEVD
ncbi:MAG: NAD(P)H-quinone oxidoreductase [Myxococcota bacterium]